MAINEAEEGINSHSQIHHPQVVIWALQLFCAQKCVLELMDVYWRWQESLE